MQLVKWEKATFEKNSLVIADNVTIDEWKELGQGLRQIEGCVQFWIGDWARFGEKKGYYTDSRVYNELEEITGLDRRTIQDYKTVSDRTSTVRHADLDFSHHREVASLSSEQQKAYLQKASEEKLSVRELRQIIKENKKNEYINLIINKNIKNQNVICGRFQDVCSKMENESIDHIITDPPYGREYLNDWNDLGKIAGRILRPSGFCICYSGTFNLPDVYRILSQHLTYYWQMIILHAGGNQFIFPRNLNTGYKPLIVFAKEPIEKTIESIFDVIKGTGKEKDLHEWAQAEGEIVGIMEKFTYTNQLILDPFAGSGTIPMACKRMGRKFIAIDEKQENINIINGRLSKE